MHNTSLSGLLRGVQSRHDDCGISWETHKAQSENEAKTNFTDGLITAASAFVRAKQAFVELSQLLNDLDRKQRQAIKCGSPPFQYKCGSPPFQYRNPRIDGPVADQDDMDKRTEWLDIIARESERLQND